MVDKNEKAPILSYVAEVLAEGGEPEKGSLFFRLH
jgi:hypothetical protein